MITSAVTPAQDEKILVSPIAKKIAEQKGIDLRKIKGTGPMGRITREDVEGYVPADEARDERVAFSGVRKVIAERLGLSKREIPHTYFKSEIIGDRLLIFKDSLNERYGAEIGRKITLNDAILIAVAIALKEFKMFNANTEGSAVIYRSAVNLGIAVDAPEGLIVPVLKDAMSKSARDFLKQAGDLIARAKAGKLSMDEISGGTFTVTNLGPFGLDEFTGIINPFETAILAVGSMKERLNVKDGNISIKKTLVCTLSVDHRVIDGAFAAKFLARLKQLMEDPEEIAAHFK